MIPLPLCVCLCLPDRLGGQAQGQGGPRRARAGEICYAPPGAR